jgi:menaquinone-9 beta-reductase
MEERFEIGIIGGGLAGLALSIQLARAGRRVVLFEKEVYPFHKVCGEYISMESWDFLHRLGLDLEKLHPSKIHRLQFSGRNGKILEQSLPLGGFGISRHLLDSTLATIAKSVGVVILQNCRVTDLTFAREEFNITSQEGIYTVRIVAASYGKRSNLDIKWKRRFVANTRSKLNNYIGVKWHVRYPGFPRDTIALHTFDQGYCGLVKVENETYNLCYLTTAQNLQQAGSIEQLEKLVLSQNPQLKQIFNGVEKLGKEPVTISQISFDQKSQIQDHVLMIGDAAGMIAPLCGNGMSMALQASLFAAEKIQLFLDGKIDRGEMESNYHKTWTHQFGQRLWMGRQLQRLLNRPFLTQSLISIATSFPGLMNWMIRQTHGKAF